MINILERVLLVLLNAIPYIRPFEILFSGLFVQENWGILIRNSEWSKFHQIQNEAEANWSLGLIRNWMKQPVQESKWEKKSQKKLSGRVNQY